MLQAFTDGSRSVRLLDELILLGFTNDAFTILHHFNTPQTIKTHRDYCAKTKELQLNGTNSLVQRRLEFILRAYWGGGFQSRSPELWLALASAVLVEIPHRIDP
jgi:hypothetical protein